MPDILKILMMMIVSYIAKDSDNIKCSYSLFVVQFECFILYIHNICLIFLKFITLEITFVLYCGKTNQLLLPKLRSRPQRIEPGKTHELAPRRHLSGG